MDGEFIADLLPQHLFAERGFLADKPVQRVAAHGRDDLDHLRVVVLRDVYLHLIEQTDLVGSRAVVYHLCGLYHPLKVPDTAAVLVLRLLCGLVLEILAQVAESAGTLDLPL